MSSYKNFWPEELSWLNKQRLILHIEWFSNSLSIMAGSGQHPSSFHHGDRVFIIFAKIVTTILWTKSFGKVPAQFGLLFCSGFISLPGSSKGPLGFSLFCLSSAYLLPFCMLLCLFSWHPLSFLILNLCYLLVFGSYIQRPLSQPAGVISETFLTGFQSSFSKH